MDSEQTRNQYDLFLENKSSYLNVITKTLSLDIEFDLNNLVTVPMKGYDSSTVVYLGGYIPFHTINTPNAVYFLSVTPDKSSPRYICLCRIKDDDKGIPSLQIIEFADENYELDKTIQSFDKVILDPYYEFCSDYYLFNENAYLIIGGKNINPFIVSFEDVFNKTTKDNTVFDCTSLLLNNRTKANTFNLSLFKGGPLVAGVYQIVVYKTNNNIITSEDYISRDIPICEFTNNRRNVTGEPYTNFRTTTNILLQNVIPQVSDLETGKGIPDPLNASTKYKILVKQIKATRNANTFEEEAPSTTYYMSVEQTLSHVIISDEFLSRCKILDANSIDLRNKINFLNKFSIHQRKLIAQLNNNSDKNNTLFQQIANSISIKHTLVTPTKVDQRDPSLLSGTPAINPIFAFNNRSFKPNEVYALYLGIKQKGSELNWYHIPGRKYSDIGWTYQTYTKVDGDTINHKEEYSKSFPSNITLRDRKLFGGLAFKITGLPTAGSYNPMNWVPQWKTGRTMERTGIACSFEHRGYINIEIAGLLEFKTNLLITLTVNDLLDQEGRYDITISGLLPLFNKSTSMKKLTNETTSPVTQPRYDPSLHGTLSYYQTLENYNIANPEKGLDLNKNLITEHDKPIRHHRIPSMNYLHDYYKDSFPSLTEYDSFGSVTEQTQVFPQIHLIADMTANGALAAIEKIPDLEYFVFGFAEKTELNSRNIGTTPVQLKERNNQAVLYRLDTAKAMSGSYNVGPSSVQVPPKGYTEQGLIENKFDYAEGSMYLAYRPWIGGVRSGFIHFADDISSNRNNAGVGEGNSRLFPYSVYNDRQFSNFIRGDATYLKLGDVASRINKQRRYTGGTTELVISLAEWYKKPSASINAIEFSYIGRDYDYNLVGSRLDNVNDGTSDWGERVSQQSMPPFTELRFKRYQPVRYLSQLIEEGISDVNNIAVVPYSTGDTVVKDIAPIGRIIKTDVDLEHLFNMIRIDDTLMADILSYNNFIHSIYATENVLICSNRFNTTSDSFKLEFGDCVQSYRTFNKYIPFADDNLTCLHSCCDKPAMDGRNDKKEDIGTTVTSVDPDPTKPDIVTVVGLQYFTALNNLMYKPLTTMARFGFIDYSTDKAGCSLLMANQGFIGEQKYNTNTYSHAQIDGVYPSRSIDLGVAMPFLLFRKRNAIDDTEPIRMPFTDSTGGVIGQRELFTNRVGTADGDARQAANNLMRQAVSVDSSPITQLLDQWVKCIFAVNVNTTKTAPSQTFLVNNSTTYLSGGYCVCDIPTSRESGPGTSETAISTYWFPKNTDYSHGFSYWIHINKPIVCEYPVVEQINHNWDGAVAGEFLLSNDATKSDYMGVQAGFIPHFKNASYTVFNMHNVNTKLIHDMSISEDTLRISEMNKLYVSAPTSSERDLSELFSFQLQNYISLPNNSFGLTKLLSYRNNLYIFCNNSSYIIEQQQTFSTSTDNMINVSQLELQNIVPKELMYDEVGGIGLDLAINNTITPFGIAHFDKQTSSIYLIDNNIRELSSEGTKMFVKSNLQTTHKLVFHTNEYNNKIYATFIDELFVSSNGRDQSKNFTLSFYPTTERIICFSFHKFKPFFVMRSKLHRFMLDANLKYVYELTSETNYGETNPVFIDI